MANGRPRATISRPYILSKNVRIMQQAHPLSHAAGMTAPPRGRQGAAYFDSLKGEDQQVLSFIFAAFPPGRRVYLSDMYFTGAFHHGIAHDDFAHRVHRDVAGPGILDGIHMAIDGGIHVRILERQIGSLHGAVDEL